MPSIEERIKLLSKYNQIEIMAYESDGVEYILVFNPASGIFLVRTIPDSVLPLPVFSLNMFATNFSPLLANPLFAPLIKFKNMWDKRNYSVEFWDNIPLNSFIVAGNYL